VLFIYSISFKETANALVTLVKTEEECLKEPFKTVRTTRRLDGKVGGKCVTSYCNGIWETTRHNRHNGLLPAPTCYGLVVYVAELLRTCDREVAKLLWTCYGETGIMEFGFYMEFGLISRWFGSAATSYACSTIGLLSNLHSTRFLWPQREHGTLCRCPCEQLHHS